MQKHNKIDLTANFDHCVTKLHQKMHSSIVFRHIVFCSRGQCGSLFNSRLERIVIDKINNFKTATAFLYETSTNVRFSCELVNFEFSSFFSIFLRKFLEFMYFYEIVLDSVFYVKWIVPVDYDRGVLASVHSTSESND